MGLLRELEFTTQGEMRWDKGKKKRKRRGTSSGLVDMVARTSMLLVDTVLHAEVQLGVVRVVMIGCGYWNGALG